MRNYYEDYGLPHSQIQRKIGSFVYAHLTEPVHHLLAHLDVTGVYDLDVEWRRLSSLDSASVKSFCKDGRPEPSKYDF